MRSREDSREEIQAGAQGAPEADGMPAPKHRHDFVTAFDFLFLGLLLILSTFWAIRTYLETPPFVDAERYPVRGIDISSHNGMMNLDAAAADGVEFAFIKATEGASFRDANFRLNHEKARHAGIKTGAYHFFRFDVDGVAQAVNFLRATDGLPLELGLAIDVEEHGNPPGVPPDSVTYRLKAMLDFMNLKGHRVTFYSNRAGYYKYLKDNFEGYPLWICSFQSNPISTDWLFWQFDHHGKVSGIKGDVDLNAFNGSRQEWEEYLRNGEL